MRTIAQPTVSVNCASHTLVAANQRLRQLRGAAMAQTQKVRIADAYLATGEAVLAQRRRETGVGGDANEHAMERGSFLVIPSAESQPPQSHDNEPDKTLRMYPDLLLGMLRQEQVAIGRIWLLCRHLDTDGRGWLAVTDVREQLTRKGSPLRIVGQRRLRQILRDGTGIFWERDQVGRLWLYGVARVAAALGVERLTDRPIALPINAIITSLAETRAHCYAALHSSRGEDNDDLANPISRETLADIAGITGRTQRRYDKLAGVEARPCIAVGAIFNPTQHAEATWQHGSATFKFTDFHGQHGAAGTIYTAWQLPNQYRGCHARLPKGRQRKLNRQLQSLVTTDDDLVNKRARGNGLVTQGERVELVDEHVRMYFDDGQQACKTSRGYLLDKRTIKQSVWIPIT